MNNLICLIAIFIICSCGTKKNLEISPNTTIYGGSLDNWKEGGVFLIVENNYHLVSFTHRRLRKGNNNLYDTTKINDSVCKYIGKLSEINCSKDTVSVLTNKGVYKTKISIADDYLIDKWNSRKKASLLSSPPFDFDRTVKANSKHVDAYYKARKKLLRRNRKYSYLAFKQKADQLNKKYKQ